MQTTDTINTAIATTSVQRASTGSTTSVMTFVRPTTLRMTAKQPVDSTPTITATSARVTTFLLTITVTGIEHSRIVTEPVAILADITRRKQLPRIITTATTAASTAAITQLTVSAIHDQVTDRKQCAKPFRTVIMTPATAPATITVPRCRASADVSQVPARHSPEKRVKLSAAFTPVESATISRRTVPRSAQTTVNVFAIVRSLYPATRVET